jgi:hypothetical protein
MEESPMELWKAMFAVFVILEILFAFQVAGMIWNAKEQLKYYKTVDRYCMAIYGRSTDLTLKDFNGMSLDVNAAFKKLQEFSET